MRPGDNLFSVSIVAIDAKTGKYRWHFQQVHHDIWDYDSPNPVVLFDAEVGGRMRKGLVEVSKTGWAYILDRETGKPLVGIEEKPVMQEPRQATSATQPFPIGDAIVPQSIDIPPEGSSIVPSGVSVINDGKIFTPFWTDPIAVKPGTMGGANWPPSSYDPESHLLYVCATDRINSFSVQAELPTPKANDVYMGGRFVQANADDRGILAALDVRTNKLAWRQQWREICYSGSVVTAGGLLFVGRNDGRLTALDKSNGKSLWEFRTDAGVNTTVTTFDWNGDQRVVVHAGGGVFAGAQRGDGIWMFSVKGTMKSLPVGGALTGGGGGPGGAFGARPPAPRREPARERRPRPPAVRRGVRRVPWRAGRRRPRRRAITRRGAARGHDRRHREGGEEQHAAVRTRVLGRRSQGRRGLRRRRAREEIAVAEHYNPLRARGRYARLRGGPYDHPYRVLVGAAMLCLRALPTRIIRSRPSTTPTSRSR